MAAAAADVVVLQLYLCHCVAATRLLLVIELGNEGSIPLLGIFFRLLAHLLQLAVEFTIPLGHAFGILLHVLVVEVAHLLEHLLHLLIVMHRVALQHL